jgi:hypothetical protein
MLQHVGPLESMRQHQGFIIKQSGGGSIRNDATVIENQGPWAKFHHELEVMCRD